MVASIELPALTEAVVKAFSSKEVISLIIPQLAEAIHEIVTQNVYKAVEMELQNRDDKIRHLGKSLESLQNRMDDLEQYSRRNCILFHGIPETDQLESSSTLMEKVATVATQHLGGIIPAISVDRIHRLGSKSDRQGNTRCRPVIVKFIDYKTRDRIYRARSALKGTNIYIHESLTPTRQKWLKQARDYPSTDRVWTQDGKIFVITKDSKRIVIASHEELAKLK